MICYVLFYLIIRVSKKGKAKENLGFFLVFILGLYLYSNPIEFPMLYWSCSRGYISFFLGIFVAKLLDWTDQNDKGVRSRAM